MKLVVFLFCIPLCELASHFSAISVLARTFGMHDLPDCNVIEISSFRIRIGDPQFHALSFFGMFAFRWKTPELVDLLADRAGRCAR
ncbi:hypothetical protein [Saccharopolyspora sp. NPDC002376]